MIDVVSLCTRALRDIQVERERQKQLKLAGKFRYTCADGPISHAECFLVLAEEFGEVGHELNESVGGHRQLDLVKLRTELIQVAAVCVAWAEKIDNERLWGPNG